MIFGIYKLHKATYEKGPLSATNEDRHIAI